MWVSLSHSHTHTHTHSSIPISRGQLLDGRQIVVTDAEAVCCGVLPCAAVCYRVLPCIGVVCPVLQRVAAFQPDNGDECRGNVCRSPTLSFSLSLKPTHTHTHTHIHTYFEGLSA